MVELTTALREASARAATLVIVLYGAGRSSRRGTTSRRDRREERSTSKLSGLHGDDGDHHELPIPSSPGHGVSTAVWLPLFAASRLGRRRRGHALRPPGVRSSVGSTPWPLSRPSGRQRAMQLLLTGEPCDALQRRLGPHQPRGGRRRASKAPCSSSSGYLPLECLHRRHRKRAFYAPVDRPEHRGVRACAARDGSERSRRRLPRA